jgi:hypothetical protein
MGQVIEGGLQTSGGTGADKTLGRIGEGRGPKPQLRWPQPGQPIKCARKIITSRSEVEVIASIEAMAIGDQASAGYPTPRGDLSPIAAFHDASTAHGFRPCRGFAALRLTAEDPRPNYG